MCLQNRVGRYRIEKVGLLGGWDKNIYQNLIVNQYLVVYQTRSIKSQVPCQRLLIVNDLLILNRTGTDDCVFRRELFHRINIKHS